MELAGTLPEPVEEMQTIIDRQTNVMARLVDDLLDTSRIAHGKIELRKARLDVRGNEQEVKERKQYELCRYVVTYEDGKTADVPVYAEIDVDDYRQKTPAALPGAQLAWTRPYEGTALSAVA